MHVTSIAVIGAGMAGISAATALVAAGHQVTVFDKSRGTGGRLSSKRSDAGDMDMGAQYFTARDHHFRGELKHWLDKGWVAEWTSSLYLHDDQGLRQSPDDQQRFVGAPRMTALSRQLLADIPLRSQTRIARIEQGEDNLWQLVDDSGQHHGPFERVVIATPPPQAVPLLESAPQLVQAVEQVEMLPGWSMAVAFEMPLDTPVDACFVRAGPLDWISRNSSKPGRQATDSWVLQSSPAWAQDNLETDKDSIAEQLLAAFAEVLGLKLPQPCFTHVHRWLYARAASDCKWGALAAPEKGLYVCGDWCLGGRVENAWLSGQQAARALMGKA